jgi:hypothetical protein
MRAQRAGSDVVDGESTIVAEARSRKRSAADVASAAEMPATMTAATKMRATAMTASAMAAATVPTAATLRNGIASGRQHRHQNNGGNPNIELRHGTLTRRRIVNSRHAA